MRKDIRNVVFSICAKGRIISSHCVPVKVNQCVGCESVYRERADGVRGQTGSTAVFLCDEFEETQAKIMIHDHHLHRFISCLCSGTYFIYV